MEGYLWVNWGDNVESKIQFLNYIFSGTNRMQRDYYWNRIDFSKSKLRCFRFHYICIDDIYKIWRKFLSRNVFDYSSLATNRRNTNGRTICGNTRQKTAPTHFVDWLQIRTLGNGRLSLLRYIGIRCVNVFVVASYELRFCYFHFVSWHRSVVANLFGWSVANKSTISRFDCGNDFNEYIFIRHRCFVSNFIGKNWFTWIHDDFRRYLLTWYIVRCIRCWWNERKNIGFAQWRETCHSTGKSMRLSGRYISVQIAAIENLSRDWITYWRI